jgi:hypothetical protein
MLKGPSIIWPYKDIIVKTCSSLIVSPWSTKAGGTPTSNMLKLASPARDPAKESQGPELQFNREHRLPSSARDPEL